MASDLGQSRPPAPADATVQMGRISVFGAMLEDGWRMSCRAFSGRPRAKFTSGAPAAGLVAFWRAPLAGEGGYSFIVPHCGAESVISVISEGRRSISVALPASPDENWYTIKHPGGADGDVFLVLHLVRDGASEIILGDVLYYEGEPAHHGAGPAWEALGLVSRNKRTNTALKTDTASPDRFDLELCRRLLSDLDEPLSFAQAV